MSPQVLISLRDALGQVATVVGVVPRTSVAVVPSSIPSDGSADVTQPLLNFFATVPDWYTIMFQPGGLYRCEGRLLQTNRNGLTFACRGSTFQRTVASDPAHPLPHWQFNGGGSILVQDANVLGTNAAGVYPQNNREFEAAFQAENVNGFTVQNCSAAQVWGDGVYAGTGTGPCANVRVSGFNAYKVGRQGLSMTWANGALIEDVQVGLTPAAAAQIAALLQQLLAGQVTQAQYDAGLTAVLASVTQSARGGIDLEPMPGWGVHNVEIRRMVSNTRLLMIPSGGYGDVNDVYIHDCHDVYSGVPIVSVRETSGARRRGWRVENVREDNPAGLGSPAALFRFTTVDDVAVRGVWANCQRGRNQLGVAFQGCGGALEVSGNTFPNGVGPCWTVDNGATVSAFGNNPPP